VASENVAGKLMLSPGPKCFIVNVYLVVL